MSIMVFIYENKKGCHYQNFQNDRWYGIIKKVINVNFIVGECIKTHHISIKIRGEGIGDNNNKLK